MLTNVPDLKGIYTLGNHVKVNMVLYLKFNETGLNVTRTNMNVLNEICRNFACLGGLLHLHTRALVGSYVIQCCSMGL